MNIDEVLLTPDEAKNICREFQSTERGYYECDNYHCCQECPILFKAAQLKLLEWLEMPCEEHDHRTLCDPDGYCLTKDCSWCMSELESKLKEG